jgi:hypothetical protein
MSRGPEQTWQAAEEKAFRARPSRPLLRRAIAGRDGSRRFLGP